MGVSYREELSKKKRLGVPKFHEVRELFPRSETEERAALRKEYFRVTRAGYRKAAAAAAKKALNHA